MNCIVETACALLYDCISVCSRHSTNLGTCKNSIFDSQVQSMVK